MIEFSPSLLCLQQRWQINRLSAEFLAKFMTVFFPVNGDNLETCKHHKEIYGTVKFVAYELLENAIKFHDPCSTQPVCMQLLLCSDRMIFFTDNSIPSTAVTSFQTFITELLSNNLQELYVKQIESNAINQDTSCSKLGLMILMLDYKVKLGWKFASPSPVHSSTRITTMAQLLLKI